MTLSPFQALWWCSGQHTVVYFCSLLLTVLLPQHVSFTGHSPFRGVFDLTWVLHVSQSIPLSFKSSSFRPFSVMSPKTSSSTFFQTFLFTYLLTLLFWDSSPAYSHLSSFLLSPTCSSCHPSSSTSDQRHSVLLWLLAGLRHDGLSPSFLESSRTCSDWHTLKALLLSLVFHS